MQDINNFLLGIDSYIGSSQWFVFILLGTGLFFTVYLKFPQIRYFNHALKVVSGRYDKKGDKGDASHFQALATALSGTVGTGNIAGVALAIHLGGPAALFWMLMTAMLGMTTKFVEVSLSHKYRETDSQGFIAGGPMYYMKNRLNMGWLAAIFAVATIISSFGTGSLPQINSISNSMFATFGIKHIYTGFVLAIILGVVIIGGIKRIVKVTDKLVPAMAIIYFAGSLLVIVYNYENIIPSFISIFSDIFTGTAATGGFLGAGMAFAFNRGVNRGLFSNEAGQGSAPIAHAAARTSEPVSEGMVSILEPFIDTVIICMLTGLVVLSSGAWTEKTANKFQLTDMIILADKYSDTNDEHKILLGNHIAGKEILPTFTGELTVKDGIIENEICMLHARSVAEEIKVMQGSATFSGNIAVQNGNLKLTDNSDVYITGKSLIHSAPLTTLAFTKSAIGENGSYIVAIGLLLFAFSTAIAWSYYGERAVTYMFGSKVVIYYRLVYVIAFFIASFTDTTIIWTISGITIVLMALPNLIGILLLRKEVKQIVKDYWISMRKAYPNEKFPKD